MKKKLVVYWNGDYCFVKEHRFFSLTGYKWGDPSGIGKTRQAALDDYVRNARAYYSKEKPSKINPEIIRMDF